MSSSSSIESIPLPTGSGSARPPTSGSSQSTSTPTGTSTSLATAPSTTPNLGAIVGGTVGGIALIAFIVYLWFFCLRNKQAPASATVQNDDVVPFNPVPARPNEVLAQIARSGKFNHNSPGTMSNTNTSTVPTASLAPLRPSGPVIPEPPYLHRQTSQRFDLASTSLNLTSTTSGRNRSEQSNNIDVRALARELAAEFYRNYSPDRGQMSELQNHDDTNTSQLNHQPPPNYLEATGPSSLISSPLRTSYTST